MNDSDFASPALANGVDPDLDPERPTWVRYQVLAAACSLAVITYIHRVGFATASAEFKTPLGLSDTHIGWLMAAFMIGYGLFEIPWGFLADRFGVRNVLAAIILGGSTLTAAWRWSVFLPARACAVIVAFLIVAPLPVRRVPGGDVPGDLADDGRLDADDRAGLGAGGDLDVQPDRRRAGAAAPGLAVRADGRLEDAAGARRRPGLALVRGLLALVPQPARGDAAGQPAASGS